MEEITIERLPSPQGESGEHVRIAGSLTITAAAELKDALLRALESGDELLVDVSDATEIDLSALQLLCAAHGSAERAGKRFRVHGGGMLGSVAAQAGFQRHEGCARDNSKSCIWVGGDH